MIWFKSCPRCGGDLMEEREVEGRYVACIQCGHTLTEAEEVVLRYRERPATTPTKVTMGHQRDLVVAER